MITTWTANILIQRNKVKTFDKEVDKKEESVFKRACKVISQVVQLEGKRDKKEEEGTTKGKGNGLRKKGKREIDKEEEHQQRDRLVSEPVIDFENLPSLKNTTEMHFGRSGKLWKR